MVSLAFHYLYMKLEIRSGVFMHRKEMGKPLGEN